MGLTVPEGNVAPDFMKPDFMKSEIEVIISPGLRGWCWSGGRAFSRQRAQQGKGFKKGKFSVMLRNWKKVHVARTEAA